MSSERSLFRRYVELLRTSDSQEYYYNHFPWQARIVAESILTFALDNEEEVQVFSSDFELYDELVYQKLIDVARRGGRVHLVLAEQPRRRKAIEAASGLCQENNVRVECLRKYNDKLNHIWLAGTAYRFELPHSRTETTVTDYHPEFPAQFAFHNVERALKVRSCWDHLLRAEDIQQWIV